MSGSVPMTVVSFVAVQPVGTPPAAVDSKFSNANGVGNWHTVNVLTSANLDFNPVASVYCNVAYTVMPGVAKFNPVVNDVEGPAWLTSCETVVKPLFSLKSGAVENCHLVDPNVSPTFGSEKAVPENEIAVSKKLTDVGAVKVGFAGGCCSTTAPFVPVTFTLSIAHHQSSPVPRERKRNDTVGEPAATHASKTKSS